MLRRKSNRIYYHEGYIFRHVKCLSDGSPLLYCDNRKTEVGCNALAHLRNGSVVLKRAHNGHKANDGIAKAKLAETSLKERAGVCSKPPHGVLDYAPIPPQLPLTGLEFLKAIRSARKYT
uniref:FLYWCH-type domain-containing protein n=1 Tax=Caenorhabditis japonica TaxID=281687 RepID=A0A8R1E2D5_CAEJA